MSSFKVLVLVLVQGVWVPAGRVAAFPLPNLHLAVSSIGALFYSSSCEHTGDVTVTLPLTVTVWDGANFDILAGQAP